MKCVNNGDGTWSLKSRFPKPLPETPPPSPPPPPAPTVRDFLIDAARSYGDTIEEYGSPEDVLDAETVDSRGGFRWPKEGRSRETAQYGAVAWSEEWIYFAVWYSACEGHLAIERLPRNSQPTSRYAVGAEPYGGWDDEEEGEDDENMHDM